MEHVELCLTSQILLSADMAHLYKNQLQIYAQKRNLNLPVYISEREGPPHACHFKSKVILEGKTYESSEHFSTIKDAENAAAKAALMSVSSSDGTEEVAFDPIGPMVYLFLSHFQDCFNVISALLYVYICRKIQVSSKIFYKN